ncbi:glycolate oxidase [Tamaricihabitans halophyticus]|uniref:Glycolate oxidase n=1 Tax=Tamaricihabitans halophyticus TaxID=1262583 RepID=A0A4R2QFW9_9PSEU|nr:FAD-linked oxidase C-terminal domain-containing protein [Tamaricihabitans halophyticus]TCP47218.1 glycolate oxidase [Tamaricihabitans halophyticus]
MTGNDKLVAELHRALPDGAVTHDEAVLEAYRYDRAAFCPAGQPAALVRVRSTEDVAAALRIASAHRVPVVPQGARTGLSGGANALDGCLLLNTEQMNQILHIDVDEQLARVEPGVINAELAAAVRKHGLYYPPDPGSMDISTIGGNVATGAGGMCCVKYGTTADFVRGLTVVLADGRIMRCGRRTAKGVAGYDLARLFVGSEGTLGIATEITLALRPAPPAPLTAVAFFRTPVMACHAVAGFLGAGYRPSVLEFMDGPTIASVSALTDLGFPDDTGAMLIAQSDSTAPADELAAFERAARECGAIEVIVAEDPAEGELLMQARRLVGVAAERLGTNLVDDVCVPRGKLAELIEGIEQIAAEHDVLITCAGHAGDGNMHPSVVFDQHDPRQVTAAQRAFEAIMVLGLELGGTITGEHGVGELKRDWLARELDEPARWAHQQLKRAFDPHGILNPGRVLVPEVRAP